MWVKPKTDWNPQTDKIDIEDWNRIEGNIQYAAQSLLMSLPEKTWTHTSWPTAAQLNRIKSNINVLLQETRLQMSEPRAPLTADELNEIEGCLIELYERTRELELSVRRCGALALGPAEYIPIGGLAWQE